MTKATGSSELVERLRAKAQVLPAQGGGKISFGGEASYYITDDGRRLTNPDGPEAADRITDLEARLARAEEALKPFALEGDNIGGHDDLPLRTEAIMEEGWSYNLTVGDFRRVHAALQENDRG